MPHGFHVQCYLPVVNRDKAKIGDTVYLKSRPDIPMTVSELPHCNRTAGHDPKVRTTWIHDGDGTVRTHLFNAVELSL